MGIKSEARLSDFEAISMIVGNSIGTGIVAVPYLARKNSMLDVIWICAVAYIVNVILHLIIAELSYNNGGQQLVKSFEGEFFQGHPKAKKIFSWIMFAVYGLGIMVGVAGNINGGARVFVDSFGVSMKAGQIIYYLIAGFVVFLGMKAVGIAQKYSVIALFGIVVAMSIGTFIGLPANGFGRAPFHWNNLLALYSMIIFATSANQAVIQVVKGVNGDVPRIRRIIFTGFGISVGFVLLVTATVLYGTQGAPDKELAYLVLGGQIGRWAYVLAGLFTLFALMTTFWTHTLSLRDVVHEQLDLDNRICWAIATIPCILFSLFGEDSFILLTRLMGGVVVFVGILLVFAYGKSRRRHNNESPICGKAGSIPFQIIMIVSTILSAAGAVIKIS